MYGANHFAEVRGIATLTERGVTPTTMSRLSSGLPIFGLSRQHKTLQKLALCRGVIPLYFDATAFAPEDIEGRVMEFLLDGGYLSRGDFILLTMGSTMGKTGTNDLLMFLPVQ